MLMKWRFAWVLALALLAGPAFALGLGQIQVRSQYGEPLLAEIPVVSSDPSELRQLQARLASSDTFARIGLQPPQGLVLELQFNVALDASGRPVIRVTSTEPVEQPLLTFLIEADWGQGRLVREYSALIDAPDTVAASAQPPIQAPVVDQGNRIVRPPQAAVEAEPPAQEPALETEPAAEPVAEALDAQTEGVESPAPQPPAAGPAAAPAVASAPGEFGPVQAGDTLSQIVQRQAREDGVSINQMMLALLRTNPDAFIGGNINMLREGAVLRLPGEDETGRLSVAEASAEVRSQVARWREMSAPRPQPAGTGASVADAGAGQDSAGEGAGASSPTTDARLEIAPPGAGDSQQAGTRSGIAAGGEGEMLRQELQETREELISRDAQVEELRARLAELEELQDQQQQLIELKDSELAAAQQRLAESNQQPQPTLAQANQEQSAGPDQQVAAGGAPWLWVGLAVVLLIAAALAWARTRRDRTASPPRRPQPSSAPTVDAGAQASGRDSGGRSPTWHAGGPGVASEKAAVAVPAPPAATPPGAEEDPEPDTPTADEPAGAGELSGVEERLELAKAYIELGDIDTARQLLQEVAAGDATPEGEEATRLLAELA